VSTNASGLAALADPTRRDLFERLADRPQAVGELSEQVPVSRPAVSQHLKVLKDAGLVIDRAEGSRRVYRIDPTGIGVLREYLDRFWGTALVAFKERAERGEDVRGGERVDEGGETAPNEEEADA